MYKIYLKIFHDNAYHFYQEFIIYYELLLISRVHHDDNNIVNSCIYIQVKSISHAESISCIIATLSQGVISGCMEENNIHEKNLNYQPMHLSQQLFDLYNTENS